MLQNHGKCCSLFYHDRLAEVEAAIEKLPGDQVKELIIWLDEYQLALGSAQQVFSSYDVEEGDDGDISGLTPREAGRDLVETYFSS